MQTIELTQGRVAKVSDCDFEELSKYKWRANWHSQTRSYRAVRTEKDKSILMHRQIMGAQPGQKVDHWNHDTLDNQRHNLRKCTSAENSRNMRKHVQGSSAYKGVGWHKQHRKWRARIEVGGRERHLGLFTSEHDAAIAYDEAARKLFGEFALTNF